MAGLVDYEALVLDLRGRLAERPSWGAPQIRALIDELEQAHRIEESADAAVLRRFGDHLTDSFLGLLPIPATPDPLATDDRLMETNHHETPAAMDEGADIRSTTKTEVTPACPPQTQPPSRPTPDSPRAGLATRTPVAATA